ncbi:hypothetical protein QFZ30_001494 [Arthrobacter pascens]|uniref:hypothetical protein n=1 Tax=Arthrobacter pascens TaxID=1677 RepID=UPI00278E1887|nr:hypothetical protein [Arthrobacter pascens]MDQ0678112.1 hypothetical protein [Arthrobacter pascens]
MDKANRQFHHSGPGYAPVMAHDCGPWLSRESDTTVILRVTDYIAGQVSEPAPVIPGMRVRYDPRRQLGDVITISSPKLLGVTLTALVVSIRTAPKTPTPNHLGVRIISAATTYTTYAQFEAVHPESLTYEHWRLLFAATDTYATFNSDPLKDPDDHVHESS